MHSISSNLYVDISARYILRQLACFTTKLDILQNGFFTFIH